MLPLKWVVSLTTSLIAGKIFFSLSKPTWLHIVNNSGCHLFHTGLPFISYWAAICFILGCHLFHPGFFLLFFILVLFHYVFCFVANTRNEKKSRISRIREMEKNREYREYEKWKKISNIANMRNEKKSRISPIWEMKKNLFAGNWCTCHTQIWKPYMYSHLSFGHLTRNIINSNFTNSIYTIMLACDTWLACRNLLISTMSM